MPSAIVAYPVGRVGAPKREKFPQHRVSLYFPPTVLPLLTPFRSEVVGVLAQLVMEHLKGRLRSACVDSWEVPGEDDSWRLVLEAVADVDWAALAGLRREILEDLARAALEWTDSERADFSRRIYLELQPVIA